MPQRRKKRHVKRRKKRRPKDAVMKQRLGITGFRGSRPYNPWSKTLTTKTFGTGQNPGTTSGTVFFLPVNNWNDPIGPLANPVAGTGTLTENRHPKHHDSAIADGYNTVQVLSWKAQIAVNWILADDPGRDFFVAYTFRQNATTELVRTAGTVSAVERLEIFTNPAWTVKHLRAIQGFREVHTSGNDIHISVPNVFKYCEKLAQGVEAISFTNERMSHIIADVNSASGPPLLPLFCTVVIMTEQGIAMTTSSVHITVAITQKVRIMRNWTGTTDLNEGEVDVHA